jgi:hypothetical protein
VTLTVIVPSKGRPLNAARLIEAVDSTAGDELTRLVIAVDQDEPLAAEYREAVPLSSTGQDWSWVRLVPVTASPQRMGPVLNQVAVEAARDFGYVGFMGDDHLPVTSNWDIELTDALDGRPGVAYGNDRVKGQELPTAVVMSADIIRSLGYMCPPGQMHLYLDDFWKLLGQSVGNLAYRDDVVIEHLHPTAGKAPWDEGYAAANSADQYSADHAAYTQFLAGRWPGDLARLRKDLGL